MNGIILGVAMLVSSAGVSPAQETSRATFDRSPFTYDLPDGPVAPRHLPHRLLTDLSLQVWQPTSLQVAQSPTAKRHTKTDRIIAVVAGACVGWVVGGAIGWAATSKPRDDVSGLRGVVIGAPIGAVVGAAIGYKLTK
jgi:hypothetical protein